MSSSIATPPPASALTAEAIDNTLYDAFGQRQVSILYKRYNQHHVVLEVDPQYLLGPRPRSRRSTSNRTPACMVPLSAVAKFETGNAFLSVNHQGQFPAVTLSFNLAPGVSLGQAATDRQCSSCRATCVCRATSPAASRAPRRSFRPRSPPCRLLTAAALAHRLYRAGHALREPHSPHHHSLHAPFGRRGRAARVDADGRGSFAGLLHRHHPAHGHREEERHHDDRFRPGSGARRKISAPEEAIYKACVIRFRPIMMTTMAALFGAVPLAIGMGTGSELRQPLGRRRGRRPHRLASADPVHHAGHLPGLRTPRPAIQGLAPPPLRARGRRRCARRLTLAAFSADTQPRTPATQKLSQFLLGPWHEAG